MSTELPRLPVTVYAAALVLRALALTGRPPATPAQLLQGGCVP